MPNFTYTPGIPDGPNNPSADQPNMKTNNDSNASIWAVDHYGFNNNNGGWHQQSTYPRVNVAATTTASQSAVYSKGVNSDGSTRTQLFCTPDNTGNEYQLTRTIAAKFTTFATITNYDVGHPTLLGGWTFLPGGMLLQYGFLPNPTNNAVITFPVSFTTFAFPTLGAVRNSTDDKMISIKDGTISVSQFQIILSGSNLPTGLYWQAVGK